MNQTLPAPKFKPYTRNSIEHAPQWQLIPKELRDAVMVVSKVLPFRTNEYVMNELIDWDRVPDDPIFRLTFPHRDMLFGEEYKRLSDLLAQGDEQAIASAVHTIRLRMNPHPAGQMTHN